MMTEKVIKIEQVYNNKTTTGTPWLKVTSAGQTYSVWESKLFPKIVRGATLNCQIEMKGKYTNIVDIILDDGSASRTPTRSSGQIQTTQADRMEGKLDDILEILSGMEVEQQKGDGLPPF